jgi:hypothetical protein
MESSTGTTGQANFQARINGNTFAIIQNPNNNQTGQSFAFTKIMYLNGSTDYVDFTFYQITGVARSILYGTAQGSGTWFSAALLVGGGGSSFTGGTVNGPTTFTGGLTANTLSATTYLGLPTDIQLTGGTYLSGTTTFTNNSGGTFNVTGFTGTWMNGFVNQIMIVNSILYYYINGSATGAVFASRTARSTPFAGLNGTAKYLVLRINTAQPASGQISIGLHINSTSSALKITIPAGSAAGVYSDLTNSASLTQLDLLTYEVINSATTGTQASVQTVGFMVY